MENIDISSSPPPAYSEQEGQKPRHAPTSNSSAVRDRIANQRSRRTTGETTTEEWLDEATKELGDFSLSQHPDSNGPGDPAAAGNGGVVVAPLRINKKKPSGGVSGGSLEKPHIYKEAPGWRGIPPAEPEISAPAYTARASSNGTDEYYTQDWQGELPDPYTGSGLPTPPFTPDRNQFSFEYVASKADNKRAPRGTDWTGLKPTQPHPRTNSNVYSVAPDRRTMYGSSTDLLKSLEPHSNGRYADVRRPTVLPPSSFAYGNGDGMDEPTSPAFHPSAFYNSVVSAQMGPSTRSNNNTSRQSHQNAQMSISHTHGYNTKPAASKSTSHLPYGAAYPSNPAMTAPTMRNPYLNGQQSVMQQHPTHGRMPSTGYNPYR